MSVAALAAIQFGGYVNPWKVGGILVLLVVWVKLLAWIDKDSIAARLPRELVNTVMMAALIGGYHAVFLPAGFWAGVWGAGWIIRGGHWRLYRDAVANDRAGRYEGPGRRFVERAAEKRDTKGRSRRSRARS